jgi:hypothetical protein
MRRGETRWCDAAEYDRGAVIERYVVRARVCVSGGARVSEYDASEEDSRRRTDVVVVVCFVWCFFYY